VAEYQPNRLQQLLGRHPQATYIAASILGTVLFPRIARLTRWPSRAGPRGVFAYIVLNAAFLFWIRQYVLPRLREREVQDFLQQHA
jgi:hypothetical protein